jgi:D-alanyl-D-alanine carboxypeptidase
MAPPSTDLVSAATGSVLQEALDSWLSDARVVGATAAVVSAAGVWAGAAGADAPGTALVPDAALALGSITKTFTAAAVMALAGDGRVDLDAPIDRYVTLPFRTNGATVRQVLNMRSGFPYDPTDEPSYVDAVSADLDRSWTSDEVLALAADETAHQGELGGEQDYNNLNFLALGALVEQVSGEPLGAVLRRDVLDPAGLERVWLQDVEQPLPPLMVPVEKVNVESVDEDGPWLPSRSWATSAGAAGAMAADAADTARWGYLLYGGFLIDPGLVDQMTQRQQPDDFYGLGTELFDGVSVGHTGSFPSTNSLVRVWPQDDVAVAVLVPAPWLSKAPGGPWTLELAEALHGALLQR